MLFACNEMPFPYDDSDGFWDRWIMLDFKYKFVDDPNTEYEKKIDKQIIEKITSDKEMTALLNWSIEGLKRLIKNKKFTKNDSAEDLRSTWKRKTSSVYAFLQDCIDVSPNDYMKVAEFNNAYTNYCQDKNLKMERVGIKNKILDSIGVDRRTKKIDEVISMCCFGIKLNSGDGQNYKKVDEIILDAGEE